MATFLLVHGAWQSAGTWDRLAPLLREQGHTVLTPPLQGLGVGNEELSAEVSLSQHISGIAAVLSELQEPTVLVGHSYAGMVISGACELIPGKVRALVYLDAFIPEHGQCVLDLLPPEISSRFRNMAKDHGGGWRLPAGEEHLNLWGLKPGAARDFVRKSLCDFSLRCFEEGVSLTSNARASVPSSYVSCIADDYPAKPFFLPFADKARRLGWTLSEVDCGHDCHVEQPEAIAKLLFAKLA